MTGWEMLAVATAGFAAGGINSVVGSGTLVTFPVLLAVGLPPVTATVSNSLGLVPGNLTGAIGYRRELAGQRRLLVRLLLGHGIPSEQAWRGGGLVTVLALILLPVVLVTDVVRARTPDTRRPTV